MSGGIYLRAVRGSGRFEGKRRGRVAQTSGQVADPAGLAGGEIHHALLRRFHLHAVPRVRAKNGKVHFRGEVSRAHLPVHSLLVHGQRDFLPPPTIPHGTGRQVHVLGEVLRRDGQNVQQDAEDQLGD